MNDPSVSPAPLVEHALASLRDNAPDRVPAPAGDATQTPRAPAVPAAPAADLNGGAGVSVGSAIEALRTVSAAARTRLADADDLPQPPIDPELSQLGPYVARVMREAQAAARAYREQTARDATAQASKLLAEATVSAEQVRRDADAYRERTVARADALLAERVQRIAELTGCLTRMAQEHLAADPVMRDQMMQFIADLTAASEQAVTEVLPAPGSGDHVNP